MLFRNVLLLSALASFANGDGPFDGGAVAGTARRDEATADGEPTGESDAATTECHDFLFSIFTDEFPEDTMYTLLNSKGDTIWKENPWGIEDQGKKFDHSACLPVDDCYTFIIFDNEEFQDGLIEAPKGGEPGKFTISYDGNIIGEYDGKTDGCFSAKGYIFGSTCPDDIPKQDTIGDCTFAKESNSDIGEDAVEVGNEPSAVPSSSPRAPPSVSPSVSPSELPNATPSAPPSSGPSGTPSFQPSLLPPVSPSNEPSASPSSQPSVLPSISPSSLPGDTPSMTPTSSPSAVPSASPSTSPVAEPSASPSASPIAMPSVSPSDTPSMIPTTLPSAVPSALPSASPSSSPIAMPSVTPSDAPSAIPTSLPSAAPSVSPSAAPTAKPSLSPTSGPIAAPSVAPSAGPAVLESDALVSPTPTDCIPFRFLIALDGFPADAMYTLVSNQGGIIWDERPWSQSDAGKVFVNEVCLDPLDCFTFTIVDAFDDGLTKAPAGGNEGSFVLEFDSESIASYDAEVDGCYTRKSYTFGAQCVASEFSVPEDGSCGAIDPDEILTVDSTPTEDEPKCAGSELDFYFSVTTDQNPDHSFFTIMGLNNGELVWEEGPWQSDDEKYWADGLEPLPQNLTKHLCLDPAECYTFWIDDRSDDGMTSGEDGHFVVQIDGEIVATYDGETDGCFKSKSYTFGSCAFTEETMRKDGACGNEVGTEDTVVVSDVAEANEVETEDAVIVSDVEAAPTHECSDSELDFHFVIATDENPHHSYFTLTTVFTSNVVWEEGPWMLDHDDERYWSDSPEYDVQTMIKHLCLDPDQCYVFYVDDRFDDGLTGSRKGNFELQIDGNVVDTYDGGLDGCFRSKSYTFGGPCELSIEKTPGDC